MDEREELPKEARFRIKTPGGEVEVIGPLDFVERRWTDVQSALMRVSERPDFEPLGQLENPATRTDDTPRRGQTKKRGGPSCASRIVGLIESDFFHAARRANEIVDKLKELATPYEAKHVAAALNHLTKSGRLRRLKGPEGDWNYVNP
jgi:hypothetical protein